MVLLTRLFSYWFTPRFLFNRFQLNLFILMIFGVGAAFGMYVLVSEVIIPRVFAATSPWVQTDWSGGSGASTTNQYSAISALDATTTSGQLGLATNTGWYNASWKYRRKITFENTAVNIGVTPEALTNFPVLVSLTSLNVDYANTQGSGQDVRFTDSDGTTLLSYEIEKWNESGTSYVWVKVPQIDATDTDYGYIYYGNADAADAQAATSVWDSNYKLVQHLGETSGTTTDDSTSNNNDGTKTGATEPNPTTGQIGGGQSFDGSNDVIDAGTAATLDLSGNVTLECWFNITDTGGFDACIDMAIEGSSTENYALFNGTGTLYFQYNNGSYQFHNQASFFSNSTWTQVVATYSNGTITFYKNGVAQSGPGTSKPSLTTNTSNTFKIGRYQVGSQGYFGGVIDEVRVSDTARSSAWIAASYKAQTDDFNIFASQESRYQSSGTLTSNIFDTEQSSAWGTLSYTSSGSTVTIKARSSNDSAMSGATAFSSCTAITSGTDISSNSCMTDGHRYMQYQVALSTSDTTTTPTFSDSSIGFSAYDTTAPITNASSIAMAISSGGRAVASAAYNNAAQPYFSWTAGADDVGGSGLKGYCIYIGTSSSGNPATSGGLLQNSPVSTSGSTCGFIVSGTSLNLTSGSYLSSALADGSTYYMNMKAIDVANNIFATSATFNFLQDATAPTNVAYISPASGSFGNVTDMNFSWPISGASAASDTTAGVLGYQYQLNGTSGTWLGTTTSSACSLDYIPAATASYTFTALQDSGNVTTGANVIYFRTIDSSCNPSATSTYRTGSISYGGAAPVFAATCDSATGVTVTPTTSTSNSFGLSWSAATPASGRTVSSYYYMINTSPPAALSTITGSTSTYIANTTRSVSAGVLTGAVKGANTVYVVAADDASNYSSSNCIKGTFTLDSSVPDGPTSLSASDASIKSASLWRGSLAWGVPSYKGTGSITYKVQRSSDNSSWSDIATTTGTAYVDTVTDSKTYYWRVGAYDTSAASIASPTYASSVSLQPKGTFTTAPDLSSGPSVSGITTKKATISWATSRTSDSKVSYGTKSGDYFEEEPSKGDQVTSHEINLTNLIPGTTYYYLAKWTDEDGNTGTSNEKSFATEPAPIVSGAAAKNTSISSTSISFTVTNAVKATVQYGKTTSYGGSTSITTSKSKSTYTTQITDLDDDTEYHFRILMEDEEGDDYPSDDYTFTTLPRPKISAISLQEVAGSAQPTVRVTWETNTAVSSIITYYPASAPASARDQVDVELLEGEHSMLIRSLSAKTAYALIVKGVDSIGNEAVSDTQRFTTATDTRPPLVTNLRVQGTIQRATSATDKATAQLIVSWDTDELSTSQVTFGEGAGTTYSSSTQEDRSKTLNHLVLISGLTPSKAYHLKALSKDGEGNTGESIDTVTITPKATASALDLVVGNLTEVFGFLKAFGK